VAGLTVGMLMVLNVISPGTVQKMTTNLLGQLALVVGFGMIAIALWIINRMTRIR
jgi:tight adherence protein B